MNRYAFLHIPDSNYCFAKNEREVTVRIRTQKDDLIEKIFLIYGCKYDFAKKQYKKSLEKRFSDSLFDYYETEVCLDDARFVYVFYIIGDEGSFYYSEDGLTKEYNFELGFYNFFQLPYINSIDVHKSVEWMDTAVFYQIFIDRFCRGDFDKKDDYINLHWGDIPNPKSFAGGDIKGIQEKLDYIRGLNVNAIYLTPIFLSKSNHKYDIEDYYSVDPCFGTNKGFKEFVLQAHSKGIRVVLDAVFNHCSEYLSQFQDVIKNGKSSKYFDWFIISGDNIDKDKVNYETFAHCSYMPKLNTSNHEVQEFLLDITEYWMVEYNIDGWRLDVSDEISHDFWRAFRKKVKELNPECVIIGENWHNAYPFLMGDQYDSIMNYSFTKACLDYFAFDKHDSKGFSDKLNEILMRNKESVNKMMLNLLDSHDTHRFFSQVGKDKDKLLSALAITILFMGTPCIYYGTEILLEGGYDPDCRRTFDWDRDNWDMAFMEKVKQLLALKKDRIISKGGIKIYAKHELFILERFLNEEKIVLLHNRGKDTENINHFVKGKWSFVFKSKVEGSMILNNGFAIVKKQEVKYEGL